MASNLFLVWHRHLRPCRFDDLVGEITASGGGQNLPRHAILLVSLWPSFHVLLLCDSHDLLLLPEARIPQDHAGSTGLFRPETGHMHSGNRSNYDPAASLGLFR